MPRPPAAMPTGPGLFMHRCCHAAPSAGPDSIPGEFAPVKVGELPDVVADGTMWNVLPDETASSEDELALLDAEVPPATPFRPPSGGTPAPAAAPGDVDDVDEEEAPTAEGSWPGGVPLEIIPAAAAERAAPKLLEIIFFFLRAPLPGLSDAEPPPRFDAAGRDPAEPTAVGATPGEGLLLPDAAARVPAATPPIVLSCGPVGGILPEC